MIALDSTSADDAWRKAARLLQTEVNIQQGRGQPTRELLHVIFSLADSRQRVAFTRAINPALAIAEVIWILSGANASEFLVRWNPRMKQFADKDTNIFHGAYGYRLGSRPHLPVAAEQALRITTDKPHPQLDQLRAAYEALLWSPDSRQVVLQIWDARIDLPDPEPRSTDVPCNLASHLMIRNGRLEWLQVMRSNDLFWGMPYNVVQFTCLQEVIAGWLGLDVGSYVQMSDSLHVYQRYWDELDSLSLDQDLNTPVNRTDLRITGYRQWEELWGGIASAAVILSKGVSPGEALTILDNLSDLPSGYVELIAVLAAESLRLNGYDNEAIAIIDHAGEYWGTSWRNWRNRKLLESRQQPLSRTSLLGIVPHSS